MLDGIDFGFTPTKTNNKFYCAGLAASDSFITSKCKKTGIIAAFSGG